jgi:hypothetical protein
MKRTRAAMKRTRAAGAISVVMAGLVPAIHVFA